LLLVLSIANMWAFVTWSTQQTPINRIAYVVTLAAACLTHYFALFIVLSQFITLASSYGNRRMMMNWFKMVLVGALLCSFWIFPFLRSLATPGNLSRLGQTWLHQFLVTPMAFSFGRTLGWRDSSAVVLVMLTVASVVLMWYPALHGCLRSYVRSESTANERSTVVLLASWLIVPVLIPFVAALVGMPLYHHRAGSVALPAFLLLASNGLVSSRRAFFVPAILGLSVLTVWSSVNYFRYPLRDDWRSATPFILESHSEGDILLIDSDIEYLPFSYYCRQLRIDVPETYAVLAGPRDGGSIRAMHYKHDERLGIADIYRSVLKAPLICLATCVPSTTPSEYEALLHRHGFVLTDARHFYRVDVYIFKRDDLSSTPSSETNLRQTELLGIVNDT
jgi:hypothetical protein